jgi:ribonucrease Y
VGYIVGLLIGLLVALAVGIVGNKKNKAAFDKGIEHRKQEAEQEIGSAEEEAKKIIAEGQKQAENKKRELLLETKEEVHKSRVELEKEIKDRRSEIQRAERRLVQKEESLEKKVEVLEQKEEILSQKIADVQKLEEKTLTIQQQQMQELQRISGFSSEEAKEYFLKRVEESARYDAAMIIKDIEAKAKEEGDKRAKDIVVTSIQRYAADHVSEVTVSVVPLPNDEMKGRIIGREGRNIRTIETLTGVDLIIDDTPEAVILSGFDPVKREVARLTLEKLILDGRIHPARIEEMVEKAQKEVEVTLKQEGDRAAFETGVHGLHPEIIRLLGKLKFRTSYGQNVLNHVIEVANLTGMMAAELGLDINVAKRAGLLHDIGKAVDHETEGSHITLGLEVCKKYGENHPIVQNAIVSHHGDEEPNSMISILVQSADSISAARPGARRETLESYIKRLEKLEEIANSFQGVEKCFAIQAGREVRIMVRPDEVTEENMVFLAKDITKKIENELDYPGQIKVNVIRETRAVDYAK